MKQWQQEMSVGKNKEKIDTKRLRFRFMPEQQVGVVVKTVITDVLHLLEQIYLPANGGNDAFFDGFILYILTVFNFLRNSKNKSCPSVKGNKNVNQHLFPATRASGVGRYLLISPHRPRIDSFPNLNVHKQP